jgi:transposase-like protein/predicted negative regulator of RcsB-dependent stress response
MDNKLKRRLEAVRAYLRGNGSLRTTAARFNINYRTLFKWVQLYKQGGERKLLTAYRKPWNRMTKAIEEEIARLKEECPDITIRIARDRLQQKGVRVSHKGIWGVWRRHGYAGYKKMDIGTDFTTYSPLTKEATAKLEQARQLFDADKIEDAAAILNSIPSLPSNELLARIPDHMLNLSRQVEKIGVTFGTMPLPQYLAKLQDLYNRLKKAHMYYSALRIGFIEVLALEWSYRPHAQLERITELKKLLDKSEECSSYTLFDIRYMLLVSEAIACAELMQLGKARAIARSCQQMLAHRKHAPVKLMYDLGALYSYLEEYQKALRWMRKVLKISDQATRKQLAVPYASLLYTSGQYDELSRFLKSVDRTDQWGHRARILIFNAQMQLMKGQPQKAIDSATQALMHARKDEVNRLISLASVTIASAHSSMGEIRKAHDILRRLIPHLKKRKLIKDLTWLTIILRHDRTGDGGLVKTHAIYPSIILARYVNKGDYVRAYNYARRKGLVSLFYRYTFFFPNVVISRLEKGKPTYLPKAVRMLPLFNHKNPVIHIRFIGRFVLHKDQTYLRVRMPPKHSAFLTHFAFRASTPGSALPLPHVLHNFWPHAQNPVQNLSHLLVDIKKALKIPHHLITITTRHGGKVVLNRGIYFTLDYHEFEEALARAQALQRADTWALARREYLHAFELWRGEPFKRMYDTWSEDFRNVAMNRFEREVIEFTKQCVQRNDYKTVRQTLKRINRIMSDTPKLFALKSEAGNIVI